MENSSRTRIEWRLAAVLALLAALGQGGAVSAGQAGSSFNVSVRLVTVARLEITEQARVLRITPDDISRGYVDVPNATSLAVSGVNRSGFALDIHPLTGIFKAIRVRWADGETEFGAEGGMVLQRGSVPQKSVMQLSYRFLLGQHLSPGDYPWPLMLSARAL